MRVLLLHNRYRNQGGEERAVGDIATLLSGRGHDVEVLERSSADVGAGKAARGLLRGGVDPDEVERTVKRMRADVVHVHNIHPLFGWRALRAARRAGARTVLHLHNFRLFCAISIGYRDGAPCFRCRGANSLPGLAHRCRGSVGEAVVYAAGLHRQQAPLLEHADAFVAVSEATAARLGDLGLPAARTVTIRNFVPGDGFADSSRAADGAYALVAGRLVEEKGFDTAIAAARACAVPLVVAGDGPDAGRLRALAGGGEGGAQGGGQGAGDSGGQGAGDSGGDSGGENCRAGVRFTGRLEPDALAELRAGAAVVLAPSRWEEPCPYSVLDALAAGVPVLASDRGGLPELVGAGAVLPPEDLQAWAAALGELWRAPALRQERGEALLRNARRQFGEDRYYEQLMGVYSGATGRAAGGAQSRSER